MYPEFQPTGSCFVAGTKILMADKSEKNIEDVKRNDLVFTYNISKKRIEIAIVEEVTSPIHEEFIEVIFENGIKNTNTLDHPYYVKNKGWCSYKPDLTSKNYGLDVKNLSVDDIVLVYDKFKDSIYEQNITSIEEIHKKMKSYNLFKVNKNHNFFANGVLVHNKYNSKKN